MQYQPDSKLTGNELCCVRGDNTLFESLDFEISAGDICQIHGSNGAGKTSLQRIICGLSIPERGRIMWNGIDIKEQREHFSACLSYIGHHNGIKGELNPVENLTTSRALQTSRTDIDNESALAQAGLFGYEDIPCRYLSAGQKRRVAIARLLLSASQIWILDEPVTALDVDGVAYFQEMLENHAMAGGIVVITSHQRLKFGSIDTRSIQL